MFPLLSPEGVVRSTANVLDAVVRGGLADLRPMPSNVIDSGPQRVVRHYLPVAASGGNEHAARRGRSGRRPPILLVPPLAAPAMCFDLRRGCSLAEHLVVEGRDVYLVDYGRSIFADRALGLEHWIDDVIPNAVRAVSEEAGGRRVRIVAWCLGGIMSLLAHAADAELPIESIAMVASPFDFSKVPMVAPLRPIAAVTGGRGVSALYGAMGGAPAPLVRTAYQLTGLDKYLMKPWTIVSNLDDRELLAQIEAVDVFMSRMHAYPGRTFGQLYHRMFRTNDLADGRLALRDRTLSLDDVTVPVLAIAGRGDGIAPVPACHHVGGLLPGAPAVTLETAPGGHLGVLTGRAAAGSTWKLLDEWLERPVARRRRRARRTSRTSTPAG